MHVHTLLHLIADALYYPKHSFYVAEITGRFFINQNRL
jgi:hypothetical protein